MLLLARFFIFVTILVTIGSLVVAVKGFAKKNPLGRWLGMTFVMAAFVCVSYLFSILIKDYFWMSLNSSLYFAGIDFMLFFLYLFALSYTKQEPTKKRKLEMTILHVWLLADALIMLLNPFCEIAVHYVTRDTVIATYRFEMQPLYIGHLCFTYLLVVLSVFHLARKAFLAPSGYRKKYTYAVLGILAVVAANALFLFIPGTNAIDFLDYSIWGYAIVGFFLYWNCFTYAENGMMNPFRNWIFENVNQGIVLFDYEDKLIMCNDKAKSQLPEEILQKGTRLTDFVCCCDLPSNNKRERDNASFQCYVTKNKEVHPLRCDYRPMTNARRELMGKLYVFTDMEIKMDLLTGFHSWDSFRRQMKETVTNYRYQMGVAVCDINDLTEINNSLGRTAGDQAIAELAEAMRQNFPKNTYFVRGQEASLIAICYNNAEENVRKYLNDVQRTFNNQKKDGMNLNMQGAVSATMENDKDAMDAIKRAFRGMRAKKLMDEHSHHSELLTSLIRALEECDSDTRNHVQRTQTLGARLGQRIGLTDVQQSDLSLLCILHDIGKIGVPLEILNKPGKLTDAEWRILQTHVEKGYQIAQSSHELQGIADMILHHHERWDGKGYPDGLSKESIPLLSRVIAVVDAYDAMTHDRAYRKALPWEAVIRELKTCAGTQFDPRLSAELLQLIQEENPERSLEEGDTFYLPSVMEAEYRQRDPVSETPRQVHVMSYSSYILDSNFKIIRVDKNFENMTGYSEKDVKEMGLSQLDLLCPEDRTEYLCILNEVLANAPSAYIEHRILRKDRSILYVYCYGKKFFDSAEREERTEVIITDSTNTYSVRTMINEEYNKAQERLNRWESKYRCDSLTGLLNHEAFRNDVETRILNGTSRLMFLMMDIDKFKEYNDTYGHRDGDQFLILVSQALTAALRKDDLACRMGGDEFAAVLFCDQDITDDAMLKRAQQICDKINMTLTTEKGGTSLSMGVVLSSELSNNTFDQMYEAADQALYQSKERGRACMSVYEKK